MSEVSPHDRFFKATLGRPDRLGKILKAFLPPEISALLDPGSLVALTTESVGEGLDVSFMDLAFMARFGDQQARVHLIVEHKSSPDPTTHFQLIHYLSGLWVREIKEKRKPLPLLPILFYHGKTSWNLPARLVDVLRPPAELLDVTPDFRFHLIDLNRVDDEDVRRHAGDLEAVLALLSLKHIFDGVAPLMRLLLKEIWERKAPHAILKPEMSYVVGVYEISTSQEMKRIVDPIAREVGMAQDIVDTWLEEALQKGVQQGIQQNQNQMIERLLQKGESSIEEIASLVGVDIERVRKVAESIGHGF